MTDTPQPAAPLNDATNPAAPLALPRNDDNESPFSVLVGEVYEGPLDLLLALIRKQDIDIYDIPIARITEQYLKYVETMKGFDVDVAAEFIYTASLLIHIKSKMLLPRDPAGPAGEDDPRAELVNRLLEHERFKTAAQMLLQKQQIEENVWSNPSLKEFRDAEGAEPEMATDVVDLVKTFQQMLRSLNTRQALVCAFLAILELIRLQAVLARQDSVFGEIVLKKHTSFDALMAENPPVQDDWR